MEDSSPSAEDILNQELGISSDDNVEAIISSADIDLTNDTERLLYASGLSSSDIKTMNSSIETQLLVKSGTLKKTWHDQKAGVIKADHIVQHDNKLKVYYESVKPNSVVYKKLKKRRDTVTCSTRDSMKKFNDLNGHDGKAINGLSLSKFELVTEACITVDMMHVLLIELMELDDNNSRIDYLTNVLESPSTWEEGYTSHARVSIISKYNIRSGKNSNNDKYGSGVCYNFSSDADIETAYSNEMKARDIPSNESPIFNSELNDILVKQAVQVYLDKLAPPTKALNTRDEAIIQAIESETFDGIVTRNNPFKQSRARQNETTLLCMLTSDEKNKVRGDIKLALDQFSPTYYTNEDVQSAVGNKTNFQPLESQPCFECVSCRTKIGYNSTAIAKDKIISRFGLSKRNDHFMPHLLSCDEFKKKEREHSLLIKEIDQCKGTLTGFTNEMAIKLSRIGGSGIVPFVYDHQVRIAEARKTFELAKEKFGDVNSNHVPLYKIFGKPEFEKLIKYIICHDGIKKNVKYDLDSLANIFERLGGVNIYEFRTPDEWKSTLVNQSASIVLHQMYIFTLRVLQEECAQAEPEEYPIENMRFGGSFTHQSNHIRADGAPPESEDAKSKNFGLDVGALRRSVVEITDEACKTMLTSVQKHNVGWPWDKPNRDMPTELYRKEGYSDVVKVVPFSVVQDSDKGREVHALIDKLVANINNDSEKTYKADYVTKLVEEATGYDRRDLADFENKKYDDATKSEKIDFLKMIEYYFERREAGGCFMPCCTRLFRNSPRKDFCWFDGHHAKDDSKEDSPSQYRKMSVEQARLERRRCVPLCRPCHMEVHHTPGKDDEFKTELEKEHTVESDGQISIVE